MSYQQSYEQQPVITLYDVPSSVPQPWAPSVWRVRLILNFKRLPYKTTWIQFSDVEARLRSMNAPPSSHRDDGRPVYALPVIQDPMQNQIVSNAVNIAEYLEYYYPARAIYPEGSRAVQSLFVHFVQEVIAKPLLPIMIPLSFANLPPEIRTHFVGTPMARPVLQGQQKEAAWQSVYDRFDQLAGFMSKNNGGDGDGLVAQGHELSVADFAICALLIWVEQIARLDGWNRMRAWHNGRWEKLRQRVDDYMDIL